MGGQSRALLGDANGWPPGAPARSADPATPGLAHTKAHVRFGSAAYVAILTDVRIDDILGANCLNIPVDRWSKNDQQRVGAVLRHLGWTPNSQDSENPPGGLAFTR